MLMPTESDARDLMRMAGFVVDPAKDTPRTVAPGDF
jgi:hypothetical protein